MIPIQDVIPSRTTPWITLGLIALSLVVTAIAWSRPDAWFPDPALSLAARHWPSAIGSAALALVAQRDLLHGSINLLALWIFGDRVEDQLGHGRYLTSYVLSGAATAVMLAWLTPSTTPPLWVASGAVAGVVGAYLVMFPRSKLLVFVPLPIFFDLVEVPAVFFAGFWFVLQLGDQLVRSVHSHVAGWQALAMGLQAAGILTGAACAWMLRRPERRDVEWWAP